MEIFNFALCLVFSAVYTYIIYSETSAKNSALIDKFRKKLTPILIGSIAILALLFILDISHVVDCGGYTGLSAAAILLGAAAWAASDRYGKASPDKKPALKAVFRSVCVCLMLEMFIFNFNSAHLFGKDYKRSVFNLATCKSEGFNTNTKTNSGAVETILEFNGINAPIGTLTFDMESNINGKVDVLIDMKDDTYSAAYRYSIASATIIQNDKRSMTVPCNFSGKVHDIRFRFTAEDGETIKVNSITANEPIRFRFSIIRFGILLLACIMWYLMTASKVFEKSYSENKLNTKRLALVFTGVLLIGALWLHNAGRYATGNSDIAKEFQSTSGNQITQELVDAFLDGRVYLQENADSTLLGLENPYDWSQRNNMNGGYAPWDHLLFNGKIYSYYGIAPVLLLFLPYTKLTGYYFPTTWATFLFSCIGIIFLSLIYMCFADKFFGKVRSSLVFMGLIMIQIVSGIQFCICRPLFYEIAQSSGFACVTVGAYFLLRSNVIGDGKISNWRIALSAVFLSLGVLCRPTLAVYCVAALLFILAGFFKIRKGNAALEAAAKTAKKDKKSKDKGKAPEQKKIGYIPYLACALIPFAVIGSVQMIYNYMRFGSFFDFGIQYSLTINDFTQSEYHTHFALIGFFNYLFQMPTFIQEFPFFKMYDVPTFHPQGYYFVATTSSLGILWKALPVLSYGYGAKAYRLTKDPEKKYNTLLLLTVCVICPAVIMFSIWESGYGTRYCVDFAWQILLGALIIAFIIYNNSGENTKKHLCKAMAAAAIICIVTGFAQIYNWVNPSGLKAPDYQAQMLSFGRLFEFWR